MHGRMYRQEIAQTGRQAARKMSDWRLARVCAWIVGQTDKLIEVGRNK